MVVELSSRISDKHRPTSSLVSCRLQNKTTSGRLTDNVIWFAKLLDSGNSPENPPLAMTRGLLPALVVEKLFYCKYIWNSSDMIMTIYENAMDVYFQGTQQFDGKVAYLFRTRKAIKSGF